MKRSLLILLYGLLIHCGDLSGQCPDRSPLRSRIAVLTDGDLPPDVQLKELLPFVHRFESCPQPQDSVFAFLLERVGAIYYYKNDNFNAVNYILRAIRVLNEKCPGTKATSAYSIRWYNYLRLLYNTLNQKENALAAIDSVVNIAIRAGTVDYDIVRNHWEKADYYSSIGDYERCLKNAAFGETIMKGVAMGADSMSMAISFCTMTINSLIAMSKYDQAENLLRKKIGEFAAFCGKNFMGTFLNQLAIIQTHNHRYSDALSNLDRSYKSSRETGYKLGISQSLNNIGSIYLNELHDPRKALVYFRNSLAMLPARRSSNSGEALEALNDYDNIASALLAEGRFDSAFRYFQYAFDQLRPGTNESDLSKTTPEEMKGKKQINYISSLIIHKGDAFYKYFEATGERKYLSESIRIYKAAEDFVAKIHDSQTELESQRNFRQNARSLYEHAIRSAVAAENATDVFYFSEHSRAILLNDQLKRQASLGNQGLFERAAIRKRIIRLEKGLKDMPPDSGTYAALQTRLFFAMQDLDLYDKSLEKSNHDTTSDLGLNHFVTLTQLQEHLQKNNQAFLEIYTGDSAVYTLLVSGGKTILRSVDKAAYDSLANAYISYISDPDRCNRGFKEFVRVSNSLFRMIFPEGGPTETSILISPDGRYFPFEALATDTTTMDDPVYFLVAHPVCYTYSARYLLQGLQEEEQQPGKDLMGIAPVQYASYLHLPDLPGSNQSLDQIGSYFGGAEKFIAGDASKYFFLHNYSQYRLIQLYTHAVGNVSGKEPMIYFADSALSLSELIPESRPLTKLVVLSACETANGEFYQGEGVFSFNREFAALGIPASIVNCWSVDNRATYQVTELFYKYLSAGDATDIALQKAKLEFLQNATGDHRLPYYWAAPVLTGRSGILAERSSHTGWLLLLLIILVSLLIYWMVRRGGSL